MKNVTLIEWSENAALTQTHHPRARFVFLVQFNATSIPPGLLSSDFPELLMDIEICVSTLSDVPSNLPSLWPPGTWLFIDHSNFTTIPDALVNMKVTFLSLSFNQISTVPAGLFMNPWLTLIGLSGNPISAIPEVPAQNLTTLDLIALDGTNVSSLPMWMDNAFLTSTSVYFGNTPLCNNASSSIQAVRSRFHRPVCHLQDDCRRLFQLA
ncbi:TPA: hypothetical protein N0F65_005687 [Lagenidium giganteum]|uniref:L domain-like protein n=1 Tax=Lagenidium giganteum TaxID=4803 RepID=A0AAV2ZE65_9STRA|nr:TPA: hypothetical protein N0F65_005687 [Lagenidium giganteum]